MKYEALVKTIQERTHRFVYEGNDGETLKKNTAIDRFPDHYGESEEVGYPVTRTEVVGLKRITDGKTSRAKRIFNALLSRGWKRTGVNSVHLDLNGVGFSLVRLGDLMQLSASADNECIKLIAYPEWRWENLVNEIMNDCDMIVKTVLEEKS